MDLARRVWQEVSADGVSDLAAGLSYRFLLAVFPFVIFLGSVGAFIARPLGIEDPTSVVVNRVATTLPGEAREMVVSQLASVLDERRPGLLSFGIVAALWAAAGGMGATMRAMNRVYDVEETRPIWKRVATAIALTIIAGTGVLLASVIAVAGNAIGAATAEAIGAGGVYGALLTPMRVLAALALMVVATAFLFWAAPDAKLPFRWVSWGATLFVVTWLAASAGFGWYVSNFGSYNATYGALGGLIVALLWFYLSAFMLLVGAELNALLARRHDPVAAQELEPADAELRQTREAPSDSADRAGEPRAPSRSERDGQQGRVSVERRSHRPGRAIPANTTGRIAAAAVGLLAIWRVARPRGREPSAR